MSDLTQNQRAHDLETMLREIYCEGCEIAPVLCVPPYWERHDPNPNISWTWNTVPFKEECRNDVPDDKHGIYSFVVRTGLVEHPHFTILLYVGKADRMSFRQEFSRYFSEMKSFKRMPFSRWLYQCRNYLYFCFCSIDDASLIDTEERKLNNALLPPGNERFDGLLNPARRAF
ncbi:hypothetical protein QPK87_04100 [Kamptonema cortianum]|nr:hypothetical protein [Kamptonema cortianum]MDL5048061.1 hypothetical protein [Oscillatoria amoena NRMC-F 0135]